MCLIADQKHMSDLKRSKIMGLVMGSIALGVLVGYPFGGILYYFVKKSTPFNVLICAIAFNLCKSCKHLYKYQKAYIYTEIL